jgi:hypothetical protein
MLKLLDKKYSIKLKAFNDKDNVGLRQIKYDIYDWRLTSQKWGEFREKLTAMYSIGNNGHHYLDSDSKENKDLQVIFSWNEYDLEFWKQQRI